MRLTVQMYDQHISGYMSISKKQIEPKKVYILFIPLYSKNGFMLKLLS